MSNNDHNNTWLFFGGAYSNLQATQALRAIAEQGNIPSKHCVHTGDAIAYCAQPNATINELRDWGVHMVMGNCEESLAFNYDDCGCGFNEGSSCDLLSKQWFDFANATVSLDNRQWLSTLPSQLELTVAGLKTLVFHGAPNNINQFIFETSPNEEFTHATNGLDYSLFVGGHSGIAFTKKVNRAIWHNAGSIGMPANDGTPRTWYSIITADKNTVSINHKALDYDHQTTQQLMLENHLTGGYHNTLASGLWPSVDVLPSQQQDLSGNAIAVDTKNFNRPL